MDKKEGIDKSKRKVGYAEKMQARRRLARRYNLPDMPMPVLLTRLEMMGVDISKLENKLENQE